MQLSGVRILVHGTSAVNSQGSRTSADPSEAGFLAGSGQEVSVTSMAQVGSVHAPVFGFQLAGRETSRSNNNPLPIETVCVLMLYPGANYQLRFSLIKVAALAQGLWVFSNTPLPPCCQGE